ncbi:MAG: hypothetical protein JW720_07590 [Sedimentisphaerales bacterium]|nr:hypothetical protein [Sedimentisphaerales bacterium]
MEKNALKRASDRAEKQRKRFSADELAALAASKESGDRLFALALMRKQIKLGDNPSDYFDLAKSLVGDSDNNCRWQALIVISESVESAPQNVWNVVAEHGDSQNADMRTAIACVLLEHLLDFDFEVYFAKVRDEIHKGRHKFIDTLETCSFDRKAQLNYRKVQSFVKNAKRGLSSSQYTG